MKKLLATLVIVACCSGCASIMPAGGGYIDAKVPLQAGTAAPTKMGKAMCRQYAGLVVMGDASIEAAMKDGGITKIAYVDWKVKNYAGMYAEFTVEVHGE